jgi:hypothetical protein
MRQSPSVTPARDYSGIFLVAILLGIVAVVLGLTMAAARPAPDRHMDRSYWSIDAAIDRR